MEEALNAARQIFAKITGRGNHVRLLESAIKRAKVSPEAYRLLRVAELLLNADREWLAALDPEDREQVLARKQPV